MTRVFFDASVLFAGLYSPTGASSYLLQLVKNDHFVGLTSETVITEVRAHVDKFPTPPQLDTFITESKLLVREHVTINELVPYQNLIEEKDIHVIVGAISMHAHFLVTLDRKHLDTPATKAQIQNVVICSPKALLEQLV